MDGAEANRSSELDILTYVIMIYLCFGEVSQLVLFLSLPTYYTNKDRTETWSHEYSGTERASNLVVALLAELTLLIGQAVLVFGDDFSFALTVLEASFTFYKVMQLLYYVYEEEKEMQIRINGHARICVVNSETCERCISFGVLFLLLIPTIPLQLPLAAYARHTEDELGEYVSGIFYAVYLLARYSPWYTCDDFADLVESPALALSSA